VEVEYGVVVYSPFSALIKLNTRIINKIGDSSSASRRTRNDTFGAEQKGRSGASQVRN